MGRSLALSVFVLLWAGCTTVGSLGLVTKSSPRAAEVLRHGSKYKDLGLVEGGSCKSFLLAIVPWGNADFQGAVDDALKKVGGDALLNVTTSNTLLGFIPIYNVFTSSCTRVSGTAVKFE